MHYLLGNVQDGHLMMQNIVSQYILDLSREVNHTLSEDKSTEEEKSKRNILREKNIQIAGRWVATVLPMLEKFERILQNGFNGDKSFEIRINEVSHVSSFLL
jgi:hypothetical protein